MGGGEILKGSGDPSISFQEACMQYVGGRVCLRDPNSYFFNSLQFLHLENITVTDPNLKKKTTQSLQTLQNKLLLLGLISLHSMLSGAGCVGVRYVGNALLGIGCPYYFLRFNPATSGLRGLYLSKPPIFALR